MRNPFRKQSMVEEVTDDLVKQQQVASAEQMRQQYVNDISSGVQEKIDQAIEDLKPKGFVLDDPLEDTALLGSLALLGGVGVGNATASKDNDDEMIQKAKELGLIT